MTAQLHDKFYLREEEYSITRVSAPLGWDPLSDLKLRPEGTSTNCWRGYQLGLHLDDEQFLAIDYLGMNLYLVAQHKREYIGVKGPVIHEIIPVDKSEDDVTGFNNNYYGLNLILEYEGSIEIAKDFIRDMYVHMGYQHSNRYKKVLRLTFKNGKLVNEEDISKDMEMERNQLDSKDGLDGMREIASGRTTNLPSSGND